MENSLKREACLFENKIKIIKYLKMEPINQQCARNFPGQNLLF